MSLEIVLSLGAAFFMAFLVPAIGYAFLRKRVSRYDAAAVAAAYGSVSAVTFVTAVQYLENLGMTAGGHMAVAMVIMESPAIICAVLLANRLRHLNPAAGTAMHAPGSTPSEGLSIRKILHESFTDGAHLLLLGSLAVGFISGESGKVMMQPFSGDLFKGMLAFFLLDMGLLVAKNFKDAIRASRILLGYALFSPLIHAGLALLLAWGLRLPVADAALLMVLSASASYIVVPAVLRYAIPEANPTIYFGLSLGVTFPLNLLLGIPTYVQLAKRCLS